jgi:rubredoxin-NAD+ reductase
LGVNLLAQTQATRICTRTQYPAAPRVASMPYEQLVLAHGAQAALPANMPAELCWRINHLDAYLKFRARCAGRRAAGTWPS